MSRPARTKRQHLFANELTPEEEEILIKGDKLIIFPWDIDPLRPKWLKYKKQLLEKYKKPGFRPYAWWYFDMQVTWRWLNWMESIPMAERRKYRTKNGKVTSNRIHTIV